MLALEFTINSVMCGMNDMKFESKFGIGEIVATKPPKSTSRQIKDQLVEVIAITFDRENDITVHCRYPETGLTHGFKESELDGDNDFNQETGYA